MEENMTKKEKDERIIDVETGELTERQLKRLEILRNFKQNERVVTNYDVEEGIYDIKIDKIDFKTNKNENDFIEFVCNNLGKKGPKKLYGTYYLTDNADEPTLTALRCLLGEYDLADLSETEIIDDLKILTRLQELVDKTAKLVVEDQNGFISQQLYKEVPNV